MVDVLVTGSSGFVGRATVASLRSIGYEVATFDIADGQDITNHWDLNGAINGTEPRVILHLAAVARFADADADPLLAYRVNVLGTENVASLADLFGIPLIYASTGSVYMPLGAEPPITEEFPLSGNSLYGCTKYLGECFVREMDAPWMILRYAHLYGAEKVGHGLIGGFLDRLDKGEAPVLMGGRQTNDFTYIEDIVTANRCAIQAESSAWNEAYNIGTGYEISAEDAGRAVCDAYGYDGPIEVRQPRAVDPARFVYDTSKAARLLDFRAGWRFEDGLRDMFEKLKIGRYA